ncbi:MAG: hypothetical protein AAF662_08650 [Pseudomonadota bacterium]
MAGFQSDGIEATEQRIVASGGSVIKSVYAFPGGKRFHFIEPSGNEFTVFTAVEDV